MATVRKIFLHKKGSGHVIFKWNDNSTKIADKETVFVDIRNIMVGMIPLEGVRMMQGGSGMDITLVQGCSHYFDRTIGRQIWDYLVRNGWKAVPRNGMEIEEC